MSIGTLLIRADASVAMGTGHVMRCLALAQAWQDNGGPVTVAMSEGTPSIKDRLAREGVGTIAVPFQPGTPGDSNQVAHSAGALHAQWVVVDGYQFGAEYQRALVKSGLKVLWIDDNGDCDSYCADIVLNQNLHAHEITYKRDAQSRLLLGPKYVLLRREFSFASNSPFIVRRSARKILVTMGGSDPGNFSQRILQALSNINAEGLTVRLAIGGSNPNEQLIRKAVDSAPAFVELMHDVKNMAELIAWADVAVAAAGTVCWEICAIGVPALLIPVAENQRRAALALSAHMAARTISAESAVDELAREIYELINSSSQRETISKNARALVDSLGSKRVVAEMLDASN